MRAFPVLAIICLALLSGCSGGSSPADAVAILGVLSQLDVALQNHESTLNTAAGDRADQLSNKIKGLMKSAAGYGSDFNKATTEQREAFVAQATNLIQEASRLTKSAGSELSGNVNRVLVAEANAIQAIPFTKSIRPFVLGTEPLSVTDVNKPVQVRAYAFVPSGVKPEDIVAQINDKELPTKIFSDGRIGFEIPAETLRPNEVNTYDVAFTERHWFSKDAILKISGDIQASDPKPWKCSIVFSVQNPSFEAQITGRPVDISADASHSTVDRTLTAEELFAAIGADATKYDSKSSKILKVASGVASSAKPCSCGRDPSATIVSQTQESIRVNLTAPSTAYGRICGSSLFKKYICGGGGSNITFRLNPTLLVDVIGASKTIAGGSDDLAVGRNTSSGLQVKSTNWKQVSAACTYQNGPLSFSDHAALDQDQKTSNSDLNYLQLSKDAQGIYLTTRF